MLLIPHFFTAKRNQTNFMNKNDCFNLGYVSKVVGLKGDVVFQLDVDTPNNYKNLESVLIQINNSLVPFFIKNISFKNTTANVSLEGIDSIEKAKELVGTSLFLPLNFLPSLKEKEFYFHEVIGFQVEDKHYGTIGIVENILEYPQQAIFKIKQGTIEILIPAKKEFILKIDRANKKIELEAPEGLIDLYTNSNSSSDEEE